VPKYVFYSYYRKNTIHKKLTRTQFDRFMKDILLALTDAMINESLEIKIPYLGQFRIRERPLTLLRKDGTVTNGLRPDWGKTWEMWRSKHPELTDDEIVKLDNKKVLFHDNEHTQQHYYKIFWNKTRSILKNKNVYSFKPSGILKNKLTTVLQDTEKQVYYYG